MVRSHHKRKREFVPLEMKLEDEFHILEATGDLKPLQPKFSSNLAQKGGDYSNHFPPITFPWSSAFPYTAEQCEPLPDEDGRDEEEEVNDDVEMDTESQNKVNEAEAHDPVVENVKIDD
ncbi:hypothetical protein RHMOL_Rhmol11G0047700 [Rhododendron molle]|uniref:Uncharacterized protein n=1 Tax=Rhododendron molle TaxID=49168 RepID=A0ACC0LP17_RHOML|nr:hypothetical protein RHMOL_Rhmol11G0047700 [Rhododendron molle]